MASKRQAMMQGLIYLIPVQLRQEKLIDLVMDEEEEKMMCRVAAVAHLPKQLELNGELVGWECVQYHEELLRWENYCL